MKRQKITLRATAFTNDLTQAEMVEELKKRTHSLYAVASAMMATENVCTPLHF